MLLPFKKHLEENFPRLFESKNLIAVSGGADSVVLTHLCAQLNLDISIAHCNFQLRGEESEGDAQFVVELADELNLQVFVEEFDTAAYAAEKKISIQMTARELRYTWFRELRRTLDFDFILTAHHLNDNLETVLINFVRGTGLDGLTGIPQNNGYVQRPLLPFSRADIEEYARNSNFKWREDKTNQSTKYFRNKIRKEIVPLLMDMNPQLLESFSKTRENLSQSSVLVEDYISALFPRIARQEDYGYSFRIKLLKTIPNLKAVLYELFRSFGFTEWDDVYDLLDAESGKIVYSKTHRLIKDREDLLLTEIPGRENKKYEIQPEEEVIMFPIGTFHFEKVEQIETTAKNTIFLDEKKLEYPLVVRKWERGDYFFPFGMKGKKKVSKFFKDEKLSLPEKESCWLLCSGSEIIWVIGYRADARFAVDEDSKNILQLTYIP